MREMLFKFEGRAIEITQFADEPMIEVGHLSEVMGYRDRKELGRMIRGKWASEFVEGRDYRFVAYSEGLANGQLPKNSPPRLFLTEGGWNLVFLKSRKPGCVDLRRFLAEEVLPQIARTGRYLPDGPTAGSLGTQVAENSERIGRLEEGQAHLAHAMKELGTVMSGLVESVKELRGDVRELGQRPAPALPGPSIPTPIVGINLTPPAVPEGFTVRSLSSVARVEGCTVPALKKRLVAHGLMADPHWAWTGKDAVVSGSGNVRQETIYRFRPGIGAELRRRESGDDGSGPLFSRGQGQQ